MAKLATKQRDANPKVIVFGPPKVGKSQIAGELSEYFNLLWIDLENGWETLLKMPLDWQERVELICLPDSRQYPIACETMLKLIKFKASNICETHGKIDCAICKKVPDAGWVMVDLGNVPEDTIVVIDSLTQLANSIMAFVCKNQPDDYKPDWEDYRTCGTLMDMFLSAIQQAPFKVVVISHEVETEQEDGTKRIVPVAGTANFSRNTAKYFGHVVYSQVKNKRHAFTSSTTASNSVTTGSRTDAVLEASAKPTLLSIFKPEVVPQTEVVATGNKVSGTKAATGAATGAGLTGLAKLKAQAAAKG